MGRPHSDTWLRFVYSQVMRLLVPAMLLRLLWRSRANPGYRADMAQRLGWQLPPRPGLAPLWIHAVSVGETFAIAPLIDALLAERPDLPLLVTSTTPTGAEQVARLFGDRVQHCWMPFDTPGATARCFDHFQPRAVALVETEVWPNLIALAARRGIPVCLLNARMSAQSARGYARLGGLTRATMSRLTAVAAQGVADARRLRVLGVQPGAVQVVGSLKFDINTDLLDAKRNALREQLGANLAARRVWVAASTHPGEETPVLAAFRQWRQRFPEGLLLLAPRHPERVATPQWQRLVADFSCQYRSVGEPLGVSTEVLVWDTLGELGAAMGLAEQVFVGGSLVPHGGHNPLEAAVWGAPVLTGPHTANFSTVYRALIAAGGGVRVNGAPQLTEALVQLSADTATRERRGQAARRLLDAQRGALPRQLALLAPYLT